MIEQKMDAERAAFEDWADSQWPGAKREQLKCDDYGEYLNSIYRDLWRGWQARASLPVGVPEQSRDNEKSASPGEVWTDIICAAVCFGIGILSGYFIFAG